MNFEIAINKKMSWKMKATFNACLLYRRTFLSDLITDMEKLTADEVKWTTENTEKLFGIIWCFVRNRTPETPEYLVWKKNLPGIQAIKVVQAIASLWAMCSVPVVDTPAADDHQHEGTDPSLSLYIYLARKMRISMTDFAEMIPGELLDIVNFEAKMQDAAADPTYKATQADYDSFFD